MFSKNLLTFRSASKRNPCVIYLPLGQRKKLKNALTLKKNFFDVEKREDINKEICSPKLKMKHTAFFVSLLWGAERRENVFSKNWSVFFFGVEKNKKKQGLKALNGIFRAKCEKTPSFPEKKKHETFTLSPSQTRQIQRMGWSKKKKQKKWANFFYSPTFLWTVERLHFPIGPKFYQLLLKARRLCFSSKGLKEDGQNKHSVNSHTFFSLFLTIKLHL